MAEYWKYTVSFCFSDLEVSKHLLSFLFSDAVSRYDSSTFFARLLFPVVCHFVVDISYDDVRKILLRHPYRIRTSYPYWMRCS